MEPRDREGTNLPDVWRRSLTESGMHRVTTRADVVVVVVFLVALVAIIVWVALAELPPTVLPS